jgi:hypothetical protein
MLTDNFVYRVVGYGEGDFTVRYYPKEEPNGMSVGIVRVRVIHNMGVHNKVVVQIINMDIDRMLNYYEGDNPEEFVRGIRSHSTSLFTTEQPASD